MAFIGQQPSSSSICSSLSSMLGRLGLGNLTSQISDIGYSRVTLSHRGSWSYRPIPRDCVGLCSAFSLRRGVGDGEQGFNVE